MSDVPYLRSINIAQDAEHPARVSHFRPTAKCVNLINRLAGEHADRAHFVVAPYGSGKSLACTYLLHLIENAKTPEAKKLLKTIADRVRDVDPQLAEYGLKRVSSKQRGLAIVLEGSLSSVPEALKSAAIESMRRGKFGTRTRTVEKIDPSKSGAIVKIVSTVAQKAKEKGCDRVTILWDEFGRHLEGLVSNGRATELSDVQVLAETVTRLLELPVTFGVILHQGFANYAGTLPQSLQAEWKKVEGRFSPIQYVDDSVELYELLGTIIESLRPNSPPKIDWGVLAKSAKEAGLFAQVSDSKLPDLLQTTWPVDPVAIHLLPKLAARTAQNERTMFGFLYSSELGERVGTDELYEYFAPTMEKDRGLGGTYRLWLETESASAKVSEPLEVTLLRLTSLLGMTLSEDRLRLTPNMLENAACLGEVGRKTVKRSIRSLVTRKLLLHRKHADQISLWHGTDVDIRTRLETERSKLVADFSLGEFLSREFPPPVWKPVRYNDEMAVRRFFRSQFVLTEELRPRLIEMTARGGLSPQSDGEIWYIVTTKLSDHVAALEVLEELDPDERLVFCVPREPVNLTEAAVELLTLQSLLVDEELIADDPLASNEIGQMIDDVQKHLGRLVDQVVMPRPSGLVWRNQGRILQITNKKDLREALSRIAESVYFETPRLNSEMITRHQPSATIVNARKKLCLGILERYGQEKLGLEGEFADTAIFRSVLLGTGLYRPDDREGAWRFARPEELPDPRLGKVWSTFEAFFTQPSKAPKPVSELLNPLLRPPIGLRAGLFPVLFASAVRAFPGAYSITRRDGTHIADLLPSEVEAICKEPQNFSVFVPELSEEILLLLKGLRDLFGDSGVGTTHESSLIGDAHEAIEDWMHTLPVGAQTSKLVSLESRRFQKSLRSIEDPQRFLFRELSSFGGDNCSVTDRLSLLYQCKTELEEVASVYSQEAVKVVSRVLDDGLSNHRGNALAAVSSWLNILPPGLAEFVRTPETKNFLRALSVGFTSETVVAEKLALLCTNRTFKHWSDETIREFDDALRKHVDEIESEVIEGSAAEVKTVKEYVLRCRISRLAGALAEITGESKAQKYLDKLVKNLSNKNRDEDGNNTGSARNA